MTLTATNSCLRTALKPLSAHIGVRIPRRRPAHLWPPNHRLASTSQELRTDGKSLLTRLKNLFLGTSIALGLTFGYLYVTDTRSGIHRWASVPVIRFLYPDAEDAHHAGTNILKTLYTFGIHPRERGKADDKGDLQVEVFGRLIDNPIGISAGLDKNADIPSALFALGPAVVEVGGATPLPQEGNEKPRVFRIASQNALINRYGLNSLGADHMAGTLRTRLRQFAHSMGFGLDTSAERFVLDGEAGVPAGSLMQGKLLAVQVAKNKSTPDADIDAVRRDYVRSVDALAKYADIIVVNVSSPNTPGLRDLQKVEPLMHILKGVVGSARSADRKLKPRVMVKVSPDEDSDEELLGICQAVWGSGVDGVIVGNTTKKRDLVWRGDLSAEEQHVVLEQGGYSGPQMYDRTLNLVKRYRSMLDEALHANPGRKLEQKVIFASGGITNGKQALDVLNAGASVAMIYTAMVYGGVGTASRIKEEVREEIRSRKSSS
ncbi:hypothetical protein FH972_026658 [Carpinus fangiana]|uniref:Dihydroorotate dehydrogenase (quinone), mitochondrial n=1 Tax=Carpinus fangiana TaxID=176857 RepID=A0A5N6L509_9ROSI|nr:hypothetical protein FH972_026658 [Carpinus fangiana]